MAVLNARMALLVRCINVNDADFALTAADLRLMRPYNVRKADVMTLRNELRNIGNNLEATLDPTWQWVEESNFWEDNTLNYVQRFANRLDLVYPFVALVMEQGPAL